MPRWEFCEIVSRVEHRRGSGLFAGEKTVTRFVAVAFTVDGDERIIAESESGRDSPLPILLGRAIARVNVVL